MRLGYELDYSWNVLVDLNLIYFNVFNLGIVSILVFDNDLCIICGMIFFVLENRYECILGVFKFFYNWGKYYINDGYGMGEELLDYCFNFKDWMMGIFWYQSVFLFFGN